MVTYRTLCEVFHEMRECNNTRNYSYLMGLIEEAQVLGNRMEAAGYASRELERLNNEYSDLKKTKKRLDREVKSIRDELGDEGVSGDSEETSSH